MAVLRSARGSKFRWNETAQRYVAANGRFVSALVIRKEVDVALASAVVRVRALAEQLRAREITLEEWELSMREISKEVHLYSAAAARGGWAQLTPDDTGRAGRVIRDEYRWIRGFTNELADGLPTDGRFLQRVELYAEAGRETFHKVERQVMLEQGKTLERSILGVADHCDGDGSCIGEAKRGWVLLGKLIAIGQRLCGRRCKCHIEYSSINELADSLGTNAPMEVPKDVPKEPDGPYRAKYASAVGDMDTCDHCMRWDGVVVAVDDPRRLPDHACTSKRGCQCVWIMIRKEEASTHGR